jgi:hypothetical protein
MRIVRGDEDRATSNVPREAGLRAERMNSPQRLHEVRLRGLTVPEKAACRRGAGSTPSE